MAIKNWKTSFEDEDVSDRNVLRKALAYKCYIQSHKSVQTVIDRLTQNLKCDDILNSSHEPKTEEYFLGKPSDYQAEHAYHVIEKKRVFPNPVATVKSRPTALLKRLKQIRARLLFISDWKSNDGNTVLGNPTQVNCIELLQSLGVAGKTWLKNQALLIISLQPNRVHKSTWVDSRLNLVWLSYPNAVDWGITRNLATGLPSLKEWVIKNENDHYLIRESWTRLIEENCNLEETNLSDIYWDGCKTEIEEARE